MASITLPSKDVQDPFRTIGRGGNIFPDRCREAGNLLLRRRGIARVAWQSSPPICVLDRGTNSAHSGIGGRFAGGTPLIFLDFGVFAADPTAGANNTAKR